MSEFAPICIYLVISPLVSLIPLGVPFPFASNSSTYPAAHGVSRSIFPIVVLSFLLLTLMCLGSNDFFYTCLVKTGVSMACRSLSIFFIKIGCSGGLALAIAVILKAIFTAEAEMMMAPSGSNSALFTYTSDLADDSASSGRSRSTASSVNQPLPGEQAMPPAPPVMQEGANRAPPYVPYPHPVDEIIGGDSVESIQRRLLGTNLNPSAHDIRMARIQAEDLFEVKVDIIQRMAGLHPRGDWMRWGARALDNPRTATGEENLARLHQMLDDLRSRNSQSATFWLLVERVRLRADEDRNSAT